MQHNKKVGEEFGAIGEGFGPSDAEVGEMSAHYGDQNGSLYLVVRLDGRIVGGCGIAPFNGSHQTCELRKLFLLKEARSLGIGKDLLVRCLDAEKTVDWSDGSFSNITAI